MEIKKFLDAYKLINTDLVHLKMDRTFNSIGSNVFFEFGKEKKVEVIKGKKIIKKEWSIWLSHVSWRITKNNKYFLGSREKLDVDIQYHLQKLLGKRFQSFSFTSQFLDLAFDFEGGYQIRTFFNWMEEDQWTIFFPDGSNVVFRGSSKKELKIAQSIAEGLYIEENYKKLDVLLKKTVIVDITFNKWNLPVFHFENDSSIHLEACAWRLEENGNYLTGCLDDELKKNKKKLHCLVGKKLEQIDIANSMMDARFQFGGGFTLKTFSCCHAEEQWKIYEGKEVVFCGSICLA